MVTTKQQLISLILLTCLISACGGGGSSSSSVLQVSTTSPVQSTPQPQPQQASDNIKDDENSEDTNSRDSASIPGITRPTSPHETSADDCYDGRRNHVHLNTNSTTHILNKVFSQEILTQLEPFAKEKVGQSASRLPSFYQQLTEHVLANDGSTFTVDHRFACQMGTFHLIGELDANAEGQVSVEFNHCRFDNLTLDGGTAHYSIHHFDTSLQLPVESTTNFNDVQGTYETSNIILNGTEYFQYESAFSSSTKKSTYNLAIHDLDSQTTTWFENFNTETHLDLVEEKIERSLSGSVYLSEHGKFSINTPTPFNANYLDGFAVTPYSAGQMRLTGSGHGVIEINTNINDVVIRVLDEGDYLVSETNMGYSKFTLP